MSEPLEKEITMGDKYGPAIMMVDQAEADAYFERLVEHNMLWGNTREEAEKIERENLGYFAGYWDNKTREQVERLFRCKHPVFGSIAENGPPTPKEAFEAGVKAGQEAKLRETE